MKEINREDYVRKFQSSMGQAVDKNILSDPLLLLMRMRLIEEEVRELREAVDKLYYIRSSLHYMIDGNVDGFRSGVTKEEIEHVLKELADLQYVVSGFAVTYGLDLETAFNRIHASNMSKLGDDGKPLYRDDGKVLKGPNYKPPNLRDLV